RHPRGDPLVGAAHANLRPLHRRAQRRRARGDFRRARMSQRRVRQAGKRIMEGVGFWESWFLWRDPLSVAVIAAALCSFVGVYIVLKRIVFVSAAMSQMSGVGVALAFFLASLAGVDPHHAPTYLHPLWYSFAFAAVGASLFSLNLGHRRFSGDTV